ncbi:MAG: carboxypeptidase regulatory-like domain-containing protein [Acidobacteria bacterium]|nr:carboxypeptidase regulatory-like domain-containing protein [Acidobacteriota bacterium]
MRPKHRSAVPTVIPLASLLCALAALTAAQSSPIALTGVVSSEDERAMEGVLVSARRQGSTITITVVSNERGRYSFPRTRLEPGAYSLRIRAIGYELDRPTTVDVTAGATSELALKLRKTQDLASQLSNGEWFMSWPGNDDVKHGFLNCTQCHGLAPIARSRYTAAEFAPVIERMGRYAQGSTLKRPQFRPNAHGGGFSNPIMRDSTTSGREGDRPVQPSRSAIAAQYLSTINLSAGSLWPYPLKTLARPTGKATRVIITEYDLPRAEALPHDAAADRSGTIWYSDFGSHVLGMLDPKTGVVVEYPLPTTKPGAPVGSLDLVFDKHDDIWMGTMYQGSLAKFDRATKTFKTWGAPTLLDRDEARIAMVMPVNHDVDGQVWIGGDNEYQVDVKTGEWRVVDYSVGLPKDPPISRELSSYGVASDSKNNFYGMNLNGTYIIKVDAKTKQVTPYPTPTPNSGPRRGHMDAQDRLWFAEFRANKIGMFDTKTGTFREWAVPTRWTNVYDAVVDTSGYAWAGGMNNDHVVRLNVETGEIVEYLLPVATNIRRVNVDNSTSPPTFWVGNNLAASIVRVEPLGR